MSIFKLIYANTKPMIVKIILNKIKQKINSPVYNVIIMFNNEILVNYENTLFSKIFIFVK